MTTVGDVFNAAMALMDELSADGEARTNDTKEYEYRTPGILNGLAAEFKLLSGGGETLIALEGLEDSMIGIPDTYALGVLHYGLAANLLTDENPTAASFYEQRYEELRDRFISRRQADTGEIENLYGGLEHGQFGRW